MTHQITGVGVAAVAAAAVDAPAATTAALVGAAWLGSLLPDADRAGARLYRRTRLERRHLPVRALGALARLPLRVLVALPHRGPTHSLFGCVVAAAITGLLASRVAPGVAAAAAAGIAVGSLAHVAGDACTPAGVPLHWPLSSRRRWLLPGPARIPTGSLREYVAAALLTATVVCALVLL
jgi:inner membrane protein